MSRPRELEMRSSAITLSDMEVFIFPELMYSLVLANLMSPRIWRWRDDPWFGGLEKMKPYREWLTASNYEAKASIGGSFVSEDIEDYYLTPYDVGYGPFVKFDHDFIGREALEAMSGKAHRKKVTLALDNVSVTDALFTMFDDGLRAKFIEFPSAVYSMHPFDSVTVDGKLVGLSTWIGYSANEGKLLTLAMLDEAHAEPGPEVTLVWGEPDGGTRKPTVERHRQVEIKAIVSPAPYSKVARTEYASGWRNE